MRIQVTSLLDMSLKLDLNFVFVAFKNHVLNSNKSQYDFNTKWTFSPLILLDFGNSLRPVF